MPGVEPVTSKTAALSIRMDRAAVPGVDFLLPRAASFSNPALQRIASDYHVHRPLLCTIRLHSRQEARRPPRQHRPRYHMPAYNNLRVWNNVAQSIQQRFRQVRNFILNPSTSFSDAIDVISGTYLAAQDTHLRNPSVSLRSTVWRTLSGGGSGSGNIPPKHQAALAGIRRAFRLLSRYGRRRRTALEAAANRPLPARYRDFRQLRALKHRLRQLQRRARSQARAATSRLAASAVRGMTRLARDDIHGQFGRGALAWMSPEDVIGCGTNRSIPDRPGAPARAAFGNHYQRLAAERRRLPRGAQMRRWLRYIPRAGAGGLSDAEGGNGRRGPGRGAALDRDITWQEVYNIIFPPSKRLKPLPCHHTCTLCTTHLSDWRRWKASLTKVPPEHRPHLKTSVASGPDGILPEVLRWARPAEHRLRYDYRRECSTILAAALNKALHEGGAPASFTRSVITPVIKSAKPGQSVDASDPDHYRGIAVSSALYKLLSLVFTVRLTHWAVLNGIISAAQIGFLPKQGCEQHVFNLLQTLKARLRHGLSTFAVFIDFVKAYDLVHLDALWTVLAEQGVPPAVVRLLQGLAETRSAQVRVNGDLSDAFPVEAGVPQGDPLSCLLFILFIESLSRFLNCDATLRQHSASALTVRMPSLFYADDVAGLSSTTTGLQRLMHLVRLWSRAWGCIVSTKRGKTEAMAFVPGQTVEDATSYAPLTYGSETVNWVSEYRYLGYPLRSDLNEAAILQVQLRKLLGGFHRYFTRNHINRALAVGLQIQLYRTTTASAADYLRSILVHNPALCSSLDREILRACRHMLGHHRHTAAALIWATTQLQPTIAVVAREQERLHLQLTNSLYAGSLSHRLLAALAAEPRSRATYQGPLTNWLHVKNIVFERLMSRGATCPSPASYSDISRCAHVHGRSVGYLTVRQQLRRAHSPPPWAPHHQHCNPATMQWLSTPLYLPQLPHVG